MFLSRGDRYAVPGVWTFLHQIPPTQLVDCSYPAYTDGNAQLPESHQRSWWIVHTQPRRTRTRSSPQSHQRSWWIVHTQPTWTGPARILSTCWSIVYLSAA